MSPLQLSVVCPLQFGPSEWYSGSGSSQAAPVGPTCLRQIRGPGLSKPVHSDRCRLEKNATQMAAISWRLTAHVRAAHVHRVRQPDVFVEAAVGGMEAWGRPQVPCQQHSQSAFCYSGFRQHRQARTMQMVVAAGSGLARPRAPLTLSDGGRSISGGLQQLRNRMLGPRQSADRIDSEIVDDARPHAEPPGEQRRPAHGADRCADMKLQR